MSCPHTHTKYQTNETNKCLAKSDIYNSNMLIYIRIFIFTTKFFAYKIIYYISTLTQVFVCKVLYAEIHTLAWKKLFLRVCMYAIHKYLDYLSPTQCCNYHVCFALPCMSLHCVACNSYLPSILSLKASTSWLKSGDIILCQWQTSSFTLSTTFIQCQETLFSIHSIILLSHYFNLFYLRNTTCGWLRDCIVVGWLWRRLAFICWACRWFFVPFQYCLHIDLASLGCWVSTADWVYCCCRHTGVKVQCGIA